MNFIKLNKDWNADPNTPDPHIEIDGSNLKLSFFMNTFIYEGLNKNDMGILEFHNCFQYRLGTPNEEGFYIYGQSRYKQFGVKWGEFYLVQDSDWKTTFPNPIFTGNNLKTDNLNHYLFYLKDETFECIAEKYNFYIIATM